MKKIRVIPRLDIKGPNLVKGIHLEGLRVVGNPEDFASYYYENEADELIFMDVVASLYERNSLHEIIRKAARNIFIPITVGGGIRSLNDIRMILQAGADKVAINTAAVKRPSFIAEAAQVFGSSTIVATIEAIRQPNQEYLAFVDNGREHTGREVKAWAKQLEMLGAGEIMITSVDREGTGKGFDLELIRMVADNVKIPVIAHGGAGCIDHLVQIGNTEISAAAVASVFHYQYLAQKYADGEDECACAPGVEGNREFLSKKRDFGKIQGATIAQVKQRFREQGISCRSVQGNIA